MTGLLKGVHKSQIDELLIDGNKYSEQDIKEIIKKYKIKPNKEKR